MSIVSYSSFEKRDKELSKETHIVTTIKDRDHQHPRSFQVLNEKTEKEIMNDLALNSISTLAMFCFT